MAVFADDIISGYPITATEQYLRIKKEYASCIKVRTLSVIPATVFTIIEITRDRDKGTLTLTQTKFIDKIAEKHKGKFKLQPCPLGMEPSVRDRFDKLEAAPEGKRVPITEFLSLLGDLAWPENMARVECAFYTASMGYLVKTRKMGITYGGKLKVPRGLVEFPEGFVESRGLHAVHDSSWGTRPRPYGGFVVMRCNGAVDVKAQKLKIVPDSTCEAETAVGSKAAKSMAAIRMVCEDQGVPVVGPTEMLGDNKAMRDLVIKIGATVRTRYFERATLIIKRLYSLLIVAPWLVSTKLMTADIFTKALEHEAFVKCRNELLNVENAPRDSPTEAVAHVVAHLSRMLSQR